MLGVSVMHDLILKMAKEQKKKKSMALHWLFDESSLQQWKWWEEPTSRNTNVVLWS